MEFLVVAGPGVGTYLMELDNGVLASQDGQNIITGMSSGVMNTEAAPIFRPSSLNLEFFYTTEDTVYNELAIYNDGSEILVLQPIVVSGSYFVTGGIYEIAPSDSTLFVIGYEISASQNGALTIQTNDPSRGEVVIGLLARQPVYLPYSENFDDGTADGFEIVSGDWDIINGQYHCYSDVAGTRQISTIGEYTWSDYKVDVDVLVHGAPIQEVLVRYQSPDDWYVVTILPDPLSAVSLWKSTNGTQEQLYYMEGVLNEADVSHHMTVEACGPKIRLSLDGEDLFVYEDVNEPILNGKVGLVAFADNSIGWHDVFFDNLEIVYLDGFSGVDDINRMPYSLTAYPNPFNPMTMIAYYLPEECEVDLAIYDLQGRLIRVLRKAETEGPGNNEAVWMGRDDRGQQAPSGVYLYRLRAGDFTETKRMTLVK